MPVDTLKVQDKLKENNIHSKVVPMPCMELFDKQSNSKDILKKTHYIALEAGSVMSWQKYIENKDNIGINNLLVSL